MLIGLIGHYCAGKNYVAKILENKGFPVIDADKLGHEAIEIRKNDIVERFGTSILRKDGNIDRRLLGVKVFGNSEELTALEKIVYPEIERLILTWIQNQEGKPCIINAALLHKTNIFMQLDFVLLVKAPIIVRFLRAKKRDKLSWKELIKRFNSQKEFHYQYLQKKVDIYNVYNRGYLNPFGQSLERQIDRIFSSRGL